MGIGTSGDWADVIAKNNSDEEKRLQKGLRPRFKSVAFEGRENIHTSTKAEEFLKQHQTPRDKDGKELLHTERGKRRKASRKY